MLRDDRADERTIDLRRQVGARVTETTTQGASVTTEALRDRSRARVLVLGGDVRRLLADGDVNVAATLATT